ncbi:hypothetical protein FHG87_008056 [Trinorchestia longiramus]|nr:hypothetical protein FHG87_008056 [Trinorchestia longiramus]
MSGRRIWHLGSKRLSGESLGSRSVRYSYRGGGGGVGGGSGGFGGSGSGGSGSGGGADDDLDDIAVVSNAAPGQLKYGAAGINTANGPRVVPGMFLKKL